ncbi:hypothetical protein OAD42_02430 [Oceanospirillaceae bacterium]|jgi:L-alanine-DL-glutamate epimerase-like enolase superfamily enzyme|nr:hypothetical protein [Oceanospirillaceae bacterium]
MPTVLYACGTYHLSGGREYKSFDATIVRVTSDNGLTGFGEIMPTILGIDPRMDVLGEPVVSFSL